MKGIILKIVLKIVLIILHCFIIVVSIALLIYNLFYAAEVDYSRIAKCVVVLMGYLLAITGIKKKISPFDYKIYEAEYKDIVDGSFSEDKKSYRKLLRVTEYYNNNQYKKAHNLLNELLKKCVKTKDYTAVYMFQALCFEEEGMYPQAIASYEKVLQYDMANSRAWSNVGIRYSEMGRENDAFQAYSSAILYDSNNPYAYCNMAAYYVRKGEAELALANALRALELNPKVYAAMSNASVAYKMLGDDINAEKYCKMYGTNGGNYKNLKEILDTM